MHLDRLDGAVASPTAAGSTLYLNLFNDVSFSASRERIEQNLLGFTSWIGRVDDDPLSTVVFTRRDGIVAGQVSTDGRTFEVRSVAPGLFQIDEVDVTVLPRELEPLAPPGQLPMTAAPARAARPQAAPVVDVLVFYTPALRNRLGNAQAQARVAQAMADTNTAMARSNTGGSVRLTGAEVLPFVESTNILGDLEAFAANPMVAERRTSLGADLVSLITDAPYSDACGVGVIGPNSSFPVTLVAEPCIANFTLAHEIGHNLGAGHAPDDPQAGGWRSYSFGYKSPSPLPAFRTVMAYACANVNCRRVLHFSNPSVLFESRVTGTPTQDNARTLREALPLVEAFRSSGPPPAPPTAPLNPRAIVSGTTVFLSWQASASGTASSYRVQAGSVLGASNLFNGSVGNVLALTISAPPGTYYVRIVAENGLGASPPSGELTLVVGSASQVPGPPRTLSGQAYGNTVVLSWLAPNVGPTPGSYLIEAGSMPGGANLAVFGVGAPYLTLGSVPDGVYYVRIRSVGGGSAGAPSNEIALRVGPVPGCQAPGAPIGLQFSRSGAFVTIQWVAASSGTPPFSYLVEVGSGSGQSDLFTGTVGTATTVSANLAPGSYFVRVRTLNACGASGPSNQVSFQVP